MTSKRKNGLDDGSQSKKSRNSESDLSQRPDFHDNTTMNKEAEAGIIEAISLRNFMCHAKMEFSFGPNVNFLIGNNGSGKSAVLTAIMIGLGGKASVTNRGSTLKNFIKTGKRTAEISIKLRNLGPDAYKHDVYGDYIVVERKLSYDGAGSYKLKNANLNVVDSRRDELVAILDHFSIQVDNPVAILTQEASKTFLHSKSPHDKYKFFLKATQLEQTKHDYVNAEESKRCASEIIKEKGKLVPEMEKEVLHWKQRFEACESLDTLKDKIFNLKQELAWAIIGERERSILPLSKELKAETLRTPKFDQKVDEFETMVKQLGDEHSRLQEKVKRLCEETEALKPQQAAARNNCVEKRSEVKRTQEVHRKICLERDSVTGDKKQIEQRIKELRQKDYSDYDEQRKARQDRICNLELQLNSHKDRMKTIDHDLMQFNGAISKIRQDLAQARNAEKTVLSTVHGMEAQLKTLESSRTNTLGRYGSWMPEAVRRIEDASKRGRFTQKPIGPIGANISLRDPKWALAIEVCLGRPLCTGFIVDNHNDERILEEIFAQVCTQRNQKPSIFTSKFQKYLFNVPKNTTSYPSILDMLVIPNPVVSNCIVDQIVGQILDTYSTTNPSVAGLVPQQCFPTVFSSRDTLAKHQTANGTLEIKCTRGIEGILLFENPAEARAVMNKKPPPGGFTQAYTIGGDQLNARPVFRMYTAEKNRAQFLTPSVEDLIRQLRDELNQRNAQLQQLKLKTRDLETEERRNVIEKEKLDAAARKLRQNMSSHEMEIKELKNFEEPQPMDVSTLESEVNELEAKLQELNCKAEDQLEKVSIAKHDLIEAEKQFNDISKVIANAADNHDPIKARFAELGDELETARRNHRHYVMKKKEHEKKLQQLQQEYDAKAADLQSDLEKARQICDQIKTSRSAQNIESEIRQIEKRITSEERVRGDRNEITQTYHKKKEVYEDVKRELNQIENFLRKLEESLHIRNQWFCQQRESLSLRTRLNFIVFLSERDYSGSLEISHTDETIEPIIQPKASGASQLQASSSKSLSGGERSFSTACFVLALWDGTSSPFRCLDEYDVFMDMVNRRITMDMMMKFAARKTGCQFIFLSPLDISGVLTDQSRMRINMRIFEMHPPERGLTQNTADDEEDAD